MDSLERSKAGLSSRLAAAQEEAVHTKAELADHASQAANLKAQLDSITQAHSKVTHPLAPLQLSLSAQQEAFLRICLC